MCNVFFIIIDYDGNIKIRNDITYILLVIYILKLFILEFTLQFSYKYIYINCPINKVYYTKRKHS